MKNGFILFILLTLLTAGVSYSSAAFAQSLFQDELETVDEDAPSRANQFFKDCVAKPVFNVSEETTFENCACASAQVEIWEQQQNTSQNKVGDFLAPAPETAELTEDILKFKIYAPCLYIPAREMLNEECTADRYNQYSSQGDPKKLTYLCSCISDGLAKYYEIAAQAHLELRASEGYTIYDPYEDVKLSAEYVSHLREVRSSCYATYYDALQKNK